MQMKSIHILVALTAVIVACESPTHPPVPPAITISDEVSEYVYPTGKLEAISSAELIEFPWGTYLYDEDQSIITLQDHRISPQSFRKIYIKAFIRYENKAPSYMYVPLDNVSIVWLSFDGRADKNPPLVAIGDGVLYIEDFDRLLVDFMDSLKDREGMPVYLVVSVAVDEESDVPEEEEEEEEEEDNTERYPEEDRLILLNGCLNNMEVSVDQGYITEESASAFCECLVQWFEDHIPYEDLLVEAQKEEEGKPNKLRTWDSAGSAECIHLMEIPEW